MFRAIWSIVRPQNIGRVLNEIDQKAQTDLKASGGVLAHRNRVWLILLTACVSLLLVHYLKFDSSFYQTISIFGSFTDSPELLKELKQHPFADLFVNVWWSFWHVIAFILLPFLVVKFWIKDSLTNYGWGRGEVHKHLPEYLLLVTPIMVFAIIASFGEEFSNFYPFYKHASRSWFDLLVWELLYILQFVAVEFFFRGFILNGLRVPFGSMSIAVMSLPYLMLHFPKLWPEAMGAILFGFFLGILALRSRSIWGGVAVHVGLALTMDIAALLQTKGLPTVWFPNL